MERNRPLRGSAPFLCCAMSVYAWGAPPAIEGVANFHQVDDHVYRGAQPDQQGIENLAKLGIKVVVDLREAGAGTRAEEKWVAAEHMRFVSVPMKGMGAPPLASVRRALDVLEDRSVGPVFVHCEHGKDRTGTVIACYRIEQDRCGAKPALAEARSLGMSRFEKGMQHFILNFHPRAPEGAPLQTEVCPASVSGR